MKKFSSIPSQVTASGGTNLLPISNEQTDWILWEMKMDADEENRAYKAAQNGMEIDEENSKQYYDTDDSWWNDPENTDLFVGDPQSDEELKAQLDALMDDATKQKLTDKMNAVHDYKDDTPDIKEVIAKKSKLVREMANNPDKISTYKQNTRLEEEAKASKSEKEIDEESTKEQQRLFELARKRTMEALKGGFKTNR